MSSSPVGLAKVYRRANDFHQCFRHREAADMQDVSELPIGTFFLVLSRMSADLGWAPVVANEQRFEIR